MDGKDEQKRTEYQTIINAETVTQFCMEVFFQGELIGRKCLNLQYF